MHISPLRRSSPAGASGLRSRILSAALAFAAATPALSQTNAASPFPSADQARREFAERLRADPANEELNLAYGLHCVETERYSHAILAFERLLLLNPYNDRARVELARACFLLGQMEEARLQFERVLAGNPPPAVRANVEKYLDAISDRRPGWRFRGRFESGILYDDNVNYGPSSQIVGIAPISIGAAWVDQLQLEPESVRTGAWGGFAAGTFLFGHSARNSRSLSFNGFGRVEANSLVDASEYNLLALQAGAGPRWQSGPSALDLPVRAEYIVRGDDALASVFGLSPTFYRQTSDRFAFSLSANLDYRDYADSSDRDGFFGAFGVQAVRSVGAKSRLLAGARVLRESPDADVWRNTGAEAFLGASTSLSDRWSLYGHASFRHSEYDSRETLAPRDRRDDQAVFALGASWLFSERWSLNASVQSTLNESTFDLYDYNRTCTKGSISYDF